MTTLVLLIRGINVGGAKPLPMARLRSICEALGHGDVRTYLQSGNVVCTSARGDPRSHARALERALSKEAAAGALVEARTAQGIARAVASNPLAGRSAGGTDGLHATFLIRPPAGLSLAGLALPLRPGEAAEMVGDVVYVYCPHGYGDTRINNTFFERKLGVHATTRNWRTVLALHAMASGGPAP